MEKIFFYTTDEGKFRSVKKLASEMGVSVSRFSLADANKTVGQLCKIKGLPRKDALPVMPGLFIFPELMLFSGFSDKRMDQWLDRYNEAGIEKIKLKAVATPFNCSWTLFELAAMLMNESRAMK